jgi:hypothetical protein
MINLEFTFFVDVGSVHQKVKKNERKNFKRKELTYYIV